MRRLQRSNQDMPTKHHVIRNGHSHCVESTTPPAAHSRPLCDPESYLVPAVLGKLAELTSMHSYGRLCSLTALTTALPRSQKLIWKIQTGETFADGSK